MFIGDAFWERRGAPDEEQNELSLVCSFFTRLGEKRTYKNVKYHAAAG
jgi:hypothetical protein